MDPGAVRAALATQQSQVAPIAFVLAAAAEHAPRLHPADWRGEAASAADRREQQLRRELVSAASELEAALRSTRAALAELGGGW